MNGTVLTGPISGMTPSQKEQALNLRNSVINPRYQGPSSIYGNSTSGNFSSNSQMLPEPSEVLATGKLGPHQTMLQAYIQVDPVIGNPGFPPYIGKFRVRIRGLEQFQVDGTPLRFGSDLSQISNEVRLPAAGYDLSIATIGTFKRITGGFRALNLFGPVYRTPGDTPVLASGPTFDFKGGVLTVDVTTDPPDINTPGEVIQTFQIEFPDAIFPTPKLAPLFFANTAFWFPASGSNYTSTGQPADIRSLAPSTLLTFDYLNPLALNPNFGVGSAIFESAFGSANPPKHEPPRPRAFRGAEYITNPFLPERMTNPGGDYRAKLPADTIRSVEVLYGDTRVTAMMASVPQTFFRPHKYYFDPSMRAAHTLRTEAGNNYLGATDHLLSDSAVLAPSSNFTYTLNGTESNNYRGYPSNAPAMFRDLAADTWSTSGKANNPGIRSFFPSVTSSVDFTDADFLKIWRNGGDYDTSPGLSPDGPTTGRAYEGGQGRRYDYDGANTNPDFAIDGTDFADADLQSGPSKQIPSPVVLGSLPAGDSSAGTSPTNAWRTLLFSPNPNSRTHLSLSEVPQAGSLPSPNSAPDFLYLDFFNMPVIEPYAISEPFSTAGRVNMNYQIAPFTYIRRETALRGVLRASLLTAVEDQWAPNRKFIELPGGGQRRYTSDAPQPASYLNYLKSTGHWGFRYPIHVKETLKQFEQRFAAGDLFRSPSEICSLWLYPGKQPTASQPENSATALVNWDANSANIKAWWYDNPGTTRKSVTADNMRERPYATLYPRLTTKSNTFTTYFKVQVLQKSQQTRADEWVEGRDQVLSEYRGSATIERYIDPSDPSLPDFTLSANADVSLDNFYRFRVMNAKRFAP
jgi:uncharacterized protein (TIGR02600 family)